MALPATPHQIIDGGCKCYLCGLHMPTNHAFAKFLLGATWRFSCRDCEPRFTREIVLPTTDENSYWVINLWDLKRVYHIGAPDVREHNMLPSYRKDQI